MVAEPVRAPADDAFVRKLVAQLSGLRAEAFADLSTQVARPFAGDAAPLTIELGGRIALAATGSVTGLGGVAPPSVSSDAGEVRTGESNWVIRFDLGLWEGPPRQVCAVPEKDRMAALLDPSVFSPDTPPAHPGFPIPVRAVDYRDRTVMMLDAATVRRISRSGEAVDASQPAIESGTDGVWRVVGDVSRSVDPARVREVLDAVGGLKAARFLGDQPGDERRFGLDPPRHRITFTHGDPETGLIQNSVLLGDPVAGDGVAAMVQGRDLIFILEPDTAARLCRPWVE